MIDFCITIKHGENFTPASLIYKWAKESRYETFYSYGAILVSVFGNIYGYDHYIICDNGDGTDTVTVSMRLKERRETA